MYISKLVSYTEDGVFIIENNLFSIMKTDGKIEETKKLIYSDMKPININFNNTLDAYGF